MTILVKRDERIVDCENEGSWDVTLVVRYYGEKLKDPRVIHPVPPTSRIAQNLPRIPERKAEELERSTEELKQHFVACKSLHGFTWQQHSVMTFSRLVWQAMFTLDESVEESGTLGGALVLRGTEFPVSKLFGELAQGKTVDAICNSFGLQYGPVALVLHGLENFIEQRGRYSFRQREVSRGLIWQVSHWRGAPRLPRVVDVPENEPPQEQLDEEAEWAELEKTALSGEQLDTLAEYFRSTGKASA